MNEKQRLGLIMGTVLVGILLAYAILGGGSTTRRRACAGAILALTSKAASEYNDVCRNGPEPSRADWRKEINAPKGLASSRTCPAGGKYVIHVFDRGDLGDVRTYRMSCSVHGDLEKLRRELGPEAIKKMTRFLPVGFRPE